MWYNHKGLSCEVLDKRLRYKTWDKFTDSLHNYGLVSKHGNILSKVLCKLFMHFILSRWAAKYTSCLIMIHQHQKPRNHIWNAQSKSNMYSAPSNRLSNSSERGTPVKITGYTIWSAVRLTPLTEVSFEAVPLCSCWVDSAAWSPQLAHSATGSAAPPTNRRSIPAFYWESILHIIDTCVGACTETTQYCGFTVHFYFPVRLHSLAMNRNATCIIMTDYYKQLTGKPIVMGMSMLNTMTLASSLVTALIGWSWLHKTLPILGEEI